MWNREEIDWLDRNKEAIDNKDLDKIQSVLPTGDSREKIVFILTLFMDGEFKVIISDVRPKHKLFKVNIYTDLFSKKLLYRIGGFEWIYSGDNPQPDDVEEGIKRLLDTFGIPKVLVDQILLKAELGV